MKTETGTANLFIDLETRPQDERPSLDEVKAPGNYKNEEAILKYKEENIGKLWRDQALHPLQGRILCIGYAINDQPATTIYDPDEKTMLTQLEDVLSEIPYCRWIGHNFIDFDFGWLFTRAVKYDMPYLKKSLPFSTGDMVNDTIRMFAGIAWHKDHRYSLKDICKFLDIPSPKQELDGSKVFDYYLEGRIDEIRSYCCDDVDALRKVWNKLK